MNIAPRLKFAASLNPQWAAVDALSGAHALSRTRALTIDWDDGSGEEWVRVLDKGHILALISTRLPFALVQGVRDDAIFNGDIVVVWVADIDEPELSCDLRVLESVFGDSARLKVIDPMRFSAGELWYATV